MFNSVNGEKDSLIKPALIRKHIGTFENGRNKKRIGFRGSRFRIGKGRLMKPSSDRLIQRELQKVDVKFERLPW